MKPSTCLAICVFAGLGTVAQLLLALISWLSSNLFADLVIFVSLGGSVLTVVITRTAWVWRKQAISQPSHSHPS